MRFLENLVSDMVRESTGINPRRVVRMVGGRRLLKMGAGAAALGGLAHVLQQHGDVGRAGDAARASTSTHSPPPPPPPPAGTSAPPPLPPLPGSSAPAPTTEAAEPDVELPGPVLIAAIRAMAAAAAADGHLADREREILERHLAASESVLDAEVREGLRGDLEDPPSPKQIAAGLEDEADRETVYRLAALVLLADGEITAMERGWLDRLGEAFGFDDDRREALEGETLTDGSGDDPAGTIPGPPPVPPA